MNEIKINTQKQLNNIDIEFKGIIYIHGNNIIILNRYTNASVVARGNASVVAREGASVKAWESASVVLKGFSQASIFSSKVKIKIFDLGRFIKPNDNIENFALYHGLKIKDNKIIMYKAVRKNLTTFYDDSFKYEIGKTFKHECDPSIEKECSIGLHISTLDWARFFGNSKKEDFVILECVAPLRKIVLPTESNGKVRTSELMVLRIVSPDEY
jgi:hypothetical protein